jgi:hypothetical protein
MLELTFFCELDPDRLQALLTGAVIEDLKALKARLSLGIVDLSPQRAAVVQELNRAGIPVFAWLLLPTEQGYYFNAHNAEQASVRYQDFQAWTAQEDLHWAGVGIDIEPDIRDFTELAHSPLRMGLRVVRRLFEFRQAARARKAYRQLAHQIRQDGYFLESYQFPLIQDERLAHSTLLQRVAGVVDVPVDREVWMIYTSFVRPNGPGILASYAPQAQAVALGVTGGGVHGEGVPVQPPLTWNELAADLRLAWSWCDRLYIFSLEGCVQQGFLEKLKSFAWDQPILLPQDAKTQIDAWRGTLSSALWLLERLPYFLVGLLVTILGARAIRKRRRKNRIHQN